MKQKQDPLLTSESTFMSSLGPINPIKRFVIDNPNPTPCYLLSC